MPIFQMATEKETEERYQRDRELYRNPTKESALKELEHRLRDVNWVLKDLKGNVAAGNSDGAEAEEQNKEIIERDMQAIRNGADPKDVMEKYHKGHWIYNYGKEYGLSGYQLFTYDPTNANAIPDV